MAAPTTAACVKKTLANPEPSTHGPSRRWRSPELAAGYWGSPAATVASWPQGATYAQDPRTAAEAPGSGGRTDGPEAHPSGGRGGRRQRDGGGHHGGVGARVVAGWLERRRRRRAGTSGWVPIRRRRGCRGAPRLPGSPQPEPGCFPTDPPTRYRPRRDHTTTSRRPMIFGNMPASGVRLLAVMCPGADIGRRERRGDNVVHGLKLAPLRGHSPVGRTSIGW
jgi:hypothetical protein